MSDPTGPPPGASPPPSSPIGDDEGDEGSDGGSPGELVDDFPRVTRARRWPLAVIGLLVIAALVGASVMTWTAGSGDGDDDSSAEVAGAWQTAEPATREEIEATVAEISGFVEQQRGLEFVEPVDVELADDDEFQDRLLADFDEDADDLRDTGVFLEGLGLVPPGTDIVGAMRSLLGGGVVGFYDPETAELVVRGAALTPYVRTTIAHELVHALDDQHHDLDRPEYDEADDEIGFGLSAVAEGDARRVESAYRDSFDEAERSDALAEEMSLGGDMDLSAVPPVLIDLIGAPYLLGEPFVERLADEGGEAAVGDALADPPRTSEQVLDPERYLAGEAAVDVPTPEVPGEVVDDGVVGQLMVTLVLTEGLGAEDARTAADGWGGDSGVAWRDGDRACVTMALVGDDAGETAELADAFERWAEEQPDASVTPGAGDGPFTVESCAG